MNQFFSFNKDFKKVIKKVMNLKMNQFFSFNKDFKKVIKKVMNLKMNQYLILFYK